MANAPSASPNTILNAPPECPTCLRTVVAYRQRILYGMNVCGYDLTGNVTGRCPECGLDIILVPLPGAVPASGGTI